MKPTCIDLPAPTGDVELGCRNIERHGFTVHRAFLSAELTQSARRRLEEQARCECEHGVAAFAYDEGGRHDRDDYLKPHIGRPRGRAGLQRVFLLVNKGRVFIDIAAHAGARAYARRILQGSPYCVGTQYGIIVRKGAPQQALHNAQPPLPFPVPMPLSLMVMIALGDQDAASGATRVVPGSHRWSAPHRADLETRALAIPLRAGDALILESRLWHGRGAASADHARLSLATLYNVDFIKTPDNHPAAIHDEVYAGMSAQELALYDFDSGCGGRFGPRNAHDRRANTSHPLPFVGELHAGADGAS